MRANPLDYVALRAQIKWQRERGWDLDKDIDWRQPVDASRYFLPLDRDAVAFPGASEEQRLALSQYLGLVVNGTIAEMESVIQKMKDVAWNRLLRAYPVNPEMWELGELFFEEEIKHSRMFGRFNDRFCADTGIDPKVLSPLLPKAFGSLFLRATIENSRRGGFAFWWIVAAAEEVSIDVYRHMHKHKAAMDPLFHLVHKKHLEDESRHRNYAFLMLSLVGDHERAAFPSPLRFLRRKTDLLFAQAFSAGWVLAELSRVFEARRLRGVHPFFDTLASCLPLLDAMPKHELVRRLFVSAPYISLFLNTRNQQATVDAAVAARVLSFPFPKPRELELRVGAE